MLTMYVLVIANYFPLYYLRKKRIWDRNDNIVTCISDQRRGSDW
jgi:hypothetical protein